MELNREYLAKLKAIVDGLSLDDTVDLNNAICDVCNYPDDRIYSKDELDDILGDVRPSKMAALILYGNFSLAFEYWRFDGFGNLVSICDESSDIDIDLDNVVHVYEKDQTALPDPVKDFLNELEEELDTDTEDTDN